MSAHSNPEQKNNPAPPVPLDIKHILGTLREKMWWLLLVFTVGVGVTFAVMMREAPEYRAFATLQVLRQEESRTQFDKVADDTVRTTEDLNTHIQLLQNSRIVANVAERIETDFKGEFLAPYRKPDQKEEELSIPRILVENRSIAPARLSLIVELNYVHPRPDIAARVANLFTEEISAFYASVRTDAVRRAVQDLREQAEIQRRKVENIEKQLVDFQEELQTISFDQRLDIDQQEMISLQSYATQKSEARDRLKVQAEMLEETNQEDDAIYSLSFIANNPRIQQLQTNIASQRIEIAHLSERYREKHPKMIQAKESLAAAEKELELATVEQTQTIRNQLALAEEDLRVANSKVAKKKQEIISMQRNQSLYDSKMRELAVNQDLYAYLYNRIQQTEAQNRDDIHKIRVVDNAAPPREPFKPNKLMNAAASVFAGCFLAGVLGLLFVVTDDRVKTNADVEKKLDLTILGMLGLIKGNNREIGTLAKATEEDPQNTETLNSIVATLRLESTFRLAKTILVTSTISNEGKTYVSSSIASAFQRYGDNTLLINCDLRAGVDRLQQNKGQGLVPYIESTESRLEDMIYYNEALECDVLPAGGSHKQPFQLYASDRFRTMLEVLSSSYDRIIIDTPPTHLFGDSLSLLPYCNGQIFVVGFGRAKTGLAKKTVKKLKETRCPMFGAVINGIKSSQAKFYYPSFHQSKKEYSYYGNSKAAKS